MQCTGQRKLNNTQIRCNRKEICWLCQIFTNAFFKVNDHLFGGGQIYNDKTLTKAGPQASDHVTTWKKNSSYFLGNDIRKTDPTNNTSLNFCERTQEYNLRPRHNQPLLVKSVKQCRYPCSGKSIDRQNENGIFKGPITVPSQIPLHRWRPRTRILALIFRQT